MTENSINNPKFDFNDISLIPDTISEIISRSEISIFDDNGKLPLFVSPMDTVIDEKNHKIFRDLGFNVCIPRQLNLPDSEKHNDYFISYGLNEIEEIIKNNKILPKRVLIDVANGHSIRVVELARYIKQNYDDVILMVGNIANPKTYSLYANIGVDYARVGIGAGHACFVNGTKIKTFGGEKNIEDIKISDNVLTHTGDYKEVYNKITYIENKPLIKINNTISTQNHKYYVIHKKNIDIIDDNNIHDYAEWVEANKLTNEYLLINLKEILSKYNLVEINQNEYVEGKQQVFDLSVKDDESYVANSNVVHNCTTSANSSIHYPMASLIEECAELKDIYNHKTKIVADGGFKNYDDIIKALGLGADYVMLGNIINKSIESCGTNYIRKDDSYLQIEDKDAPDFFKDGVDVYKLFRGMSTKDVQKKWGKKELRTSEGIIKMNKVEYTIGGWVNNFTDYLKSCMSYQGKEKLYDFISFAEYVFITQNAYIRFNK